MYLIHAASASSGHHTLLRHVLGLIAMRYSGETYRFRKSPAPWPQDATNACPETCREKATGTPDRQYGEHARHPRVDQDIPDPAASRPRQGQLASARQVHVRFRGQFAYVAGELADGNRCR